MAQLYILDNKLFISVLTRVSDPHFFVDPDPGKNLHADPDPDPDSGGIWGRGLGVKGKNDFFFFSFFTFQMILNNGCLKSEQKK